MGQEGGGRGKLPDLQNISKTTRRKTSSIATSAYSTIISIDCTSKLQLLTREQAQQQGMAHTTAGVGRGGGGVGTRRKRRFTQRAVGSYVVTVSQTARRLDSTRMYVDPNLNFLRN